MNKCECRLGCRCAENPGPAAILVMREGEPAPKHVCTRCHLRNTDQVLSITVPTNPPPMALLEYDALGWAALVVGLPHVRPGGEA